MRFYSYGPNRYICEVLDEIKKAYDNRHCSVIPGLVEEARTLASRMEAAISDLKNIESMHEERRKLKKELKELDAKLRNKKEKAGENE